MSLSDKVVEALRKANYFRGVKKIAIRRKGKFLGKVRAADSDVERHEKWLRQNRATATPAQISWHEGALTKAKNVRGRAHGKLTFWRKRFVWARNRDEFWEELLAARKHKLKKAQQGREINASDFEKEMTRGHEWHTLPPATKAIIAIGTLRFGLWTSSTYRPETPGSHHAENPTRVADMAGEWEDMIAFQEFLIQFAAAILELFGPDNSIAANDGVKTSLAEGTFLEDLHDSHVHAGFMQLDYPLAFKGS